jgi:hypothetical protein
VLSAEKHGPAGGRQFIMHGRFWHDGIVPHVVLFFADQASTA